MQENKRRNSMFCLSIPPIQNG